MGFQIQNCIKPTLLEKLDYHQLFDIYFNLLSYTNYSAQWYICKFFCLGKSNSSPCPDSIHHWVCFDCRTNIGTLLHWAILPTEVLCLPKFHKKMLPLKENLKWVSAYNLWKKILLTTWAVLFVSQISYIQWNDSICDTYRCYNTYLTFSCLTFSAGSFSWNSFCSYLLSPLFQNNWLLSLSNDPVSFFSKLRINMHASNYISTFLYTWGSWHAHVNLLCSAFQ